MRILNVTQTYAPFFEFGGPPVKVRALAEGMVRRDHDVTVLTADWGLDRRLRQNPELPIAEHNPFGRKSVLNGVTTIYLPNWLHYRATSWNPALPRYLRARLQNFDIVHIFGLYDILGLRVAAACRRRGVPYVLEPIGMFVPIVRSLWLKRIYREFFGDKMLAHAGAVIATSDQERTELITGGVAKTKIVLRRNGVDVPVSLPPRGSFRESLNIPREAKLVLFLGRLSSKKSPDLLLRAFASPDLQVLDSPYHLAFVGPDEAGMLQNLRQIAGRLCIADRVHFSEPLDGDAKWAAYRDADIFVLPSQNENFGNTAAEAVAAGIPVIVTDRCGIAPLLDGIAGVVVKHEQRDLTAALKELLQNTAFYGRLQRGCAIASRKLNWDEPVQQMEVAYRRLVDPLQPTTN